MNHHLEHLISRWGAAPLFAAAVTAIMAAVVLAIEVSRFFKRRR